MLLRTIYKKGLALRTRSPHYYVAVIICITLTLVCCSHTACCLLPAGGLTNEGCRRGQAVENPVSPEMAQGQRQGRWPPERVRFAQRLAEPATETHDIFYLVPQAHGGKKCEGYSLDAAKNQQRARRGGRSVRHSDWGSECNYNNNRRIVAWSVPCAYCL